MYQIDHESSNNVGCGDEGTASNTQDAVHFVQHILPLLTRLFCVLAVYFIPIEHCLARFNPQLVIMNCANCHQHAELAAFTENADQLYTTLLQFKREQRPALVMNRISKGLSDDELRLIADYIATKHEQ